METGKQTPAFSCISKTTENKAQNGRIFLIYQHGAYLIPIKMDFVISPLFRTIAKFVCMTIFTSSHHVLVDSYGWQLTCNTPVLLH